MAEVLWSTHLQSSPSADICHITFVVTIFLVICMLFSDPPFGFFFAQQKIMETIFWSNTTQITISRGPMQKLILGAGGGA